MTTPIDRLIDAATVCVHCGQRGKPYTCGCWTPCACGNMKLRTDEYCGPGCVEYLGQWYRAVGEEVTVRLMRYLATMYPDAYRAMPQAMKKSIANIVPRMVEDVMREDLERQ